MQELTVTGKQNFMGKNIPVVAGGFGKNQKCSRKEIRNIALGRKERLPPWPLGTREAQTH